MSENKHSCGCKHHHDHEHEHHHEHSHEHEHSHSCGGGCCCSNGGGCCGSKQEPIQLTAEQKEFLAELASNGSLPVARFIAENSENDDISIVMLAPVHLLTAADSMATVKSTGAFLNDLEDAGLLSLDYGEALEAYPYLEYEQSVLFAYFRETVREASEKLSEFLADTPVLERGSMSITALGEKSLAIS